MAEKDDVSLNQSKLVELQVELKQLKERVDDSERKVEEASEKIVALRTGMAGLLAAGAVLIFFGRSALRDLKMPDSIDANEVSTKVLEADEIITKRLIVRETDSGARAELVFRGGTPVLEFLAVSESEPRVRLGLNPEPDSPNSPVLLLQREQADASVFGAVLTVGRDNVASPNDPGSALGLAGAQLSYFEREGKRVSDVHMSLTHYPSKGGSLQFLNGQLVDGRVNPWLSIVGNKEEGGRIMLYSEQGAEVSGESGPILMLRNFSVDGPSQPALIWREADGSQGVIAVSDIQEKTSGEEEE